MLHVVRNSMSSNRFFVNHICHILIFLINSFSLVFEYVLGTQTSGLKCLDFLKDFEKLNISFAVFAFECIKIKSAPDLE